MLEENLSDPKNSPAEVALTLITFVESELPAGGASAEARFFDLFVPLCQRVFGEISTKDYRHEIGGWLSRTTRWERTTSATKSPSRPYGSIKSSQQNSIRSDPVVKLLGASTRATTGPSNDQGPVPLIAAFAKEAEYRDNVRYEFPFLGLPKPVQEDWLAMIQIGLGGVAPDNRQPSRNLTLLLGSLFRVNPVGQTKLIVYQQAKVQKKDQKRPLQLGSHLYSSPNKLYSPNGPGTPVMQNQEKADAPPSVFLSMLEYYLVVFIRYPLATPETQAATASSSASAPRIGSIHRSPYLSSRNVEPYGETVYYELFTQYINYYVPVRGSRRGNFEFASLQRPSELFVRITMALWLEGQNELAPTATACAALQQRRGPDVSLDLDASFDLVKATYRAPPKQVVRCLHSLVLKVVADSTLADVAEHVRKDLKGRSLDFLCLSKTMEIMQQPFFNHIRNVFRHASMHSKDSIFHSTMNDWLAWLEPWNTQYYSTKNTVRGTVSRSSKDRSPTQARYVQPKATQSSRYTPDWEAYIASNLHFYTVPLALFLRRARELDFSPAVHQKSLEIVMKVFRVYSKDVVAVINRLLQERRNGVRGDSSSPAPSVVNYVGMVKKHEHNLGSFAPPEVFLSLSSLRNDVHNLLEEMYLQHLKNVEKLDFLDRAIAAIEGAFGSGQSKKEERDLHAITEKAKAIFGFPNDYQVVADKSKPRGTDQRAEKAVASERTAEGFFSSSGLARIAEGEIKCKPEDVVYRGDRMHSRVQSYEWKPAVDVLINVSEALNKRFGLDEEGKRVNLRFFADYRNILFIFLIFQILRWILT